MCGRYVTVTETSVIEKSLNVRVDIELEKNFNAAPGQTLPIITSDDHKTVQGFNFGYLPPWAKSKHKSLINIKSESILKLGSNSQGYFSHVKAATTMRRCVALANCFIEWNRETKAPYVIYVKDHRLVLFAGIHTTWLNPETGQEVNSFGIITQPGNQTMQTIGHHRQPLILTMGNYHHWLQASRLADVTPLLNTQLPDKLFNAYPIGKEIGNVRNTGKELIQPIGQRVKPEYDIITTTKDVLKEGRRR